MVVRASRPHIISLDLAISCRVVGRELKTHKSQLKSQTSKLPRAVRPDIHQSGWTSAGETPAPPSWVLASAGTGNTPEFSILNSQF
jgi:hypothetical protein